MILRKKVVFWDVLLYLLIGLTVSMTALSVGPLIAFGFLLIPALTAHQYARNMRQFTAGLFDRGRYGFFSASGSHINGICRSARRMLSSLAYFIR